MHMEVSSNKGTPKSSTLPGLSLINHPLLGYPLLWKPTCIIYAFGVGHLQSSAKLDSSVGQIWVDKLLRTLWVNMPLAINMGNTRRTNTGISKETSQHINICVVSMPNYAEFMHRFWLHGYLALGRIHMWPSKNIYDWLSQPTVDKNLFQVLDTELKHEG